MEKQEDDINFDKLPHAWDVFKRANDKKKIQVYINFWFPIKCRINEINLSSWKDKIWWWIFNWPQGKWDLLIIEIIKKIPESLFNELHLFNAKSIVLWYINEVLPAINNEIVKSKIETFNLLLKRYSTLDIVGVDVRDKKWNIKKIDRPISIWDFPFDEKINDIYFHDLINAIQSFFETDYNETIRKLITSIDAYMKKNKRIGAILKDEKRNNTFKGKLDNNFKEWNSFIKTIIERIKFIYDIRNSIVHESKSINPEDRIFVDLAIGSTFYFYQFVANSKNQANFFLQLDMYYNSLKDIVLGRNIRNFKEVKRKGKIKTIRSSKDMDDMMEKTFKLSEKEKEKVNKNLLKSFF